MATWTNDQWRSTKHRVRVPPPERRARAAGVDPVLPPPQLERRDRVPARVRVARRAAAVPRRSRRASTCSARSTRRTPDDVGPGHRLCGRADAVSRARSTTPARASGSWPSSGHGVDDGLVGRHVRRRWPSSSPCRSTVKLAGRPGGPGEPRGYSYVGATAQANAHEDAATLTDLVETFNAGLDPVPDTDVLPGGGRVLHPERLAGRRRPALPRRVGASTCAAMQAPRRADHGADGRGARSGRRLVRPADRPADGVDHGEPLPGARPRAGRRTSSAAAPTPTTARSRCWPPTACPGCSCATPTGRGRRTDPVPGAFHVNTGDMIAALERRPLALDVAPRRPAARRAAVPRAHEHRLLPQPQRRRGRSAPLPGLDGARVPTGSSRSSPAATCAPSSTATTRPVRRADPVTSARPDPSDRCGREREDGIDGGTGRAGGALRGAPGPPAGRGLPDARIARPTPTTPCRRRGCAAAGPTPREVEQPRRLADDRRGPGLPRHAADPRTSRREEPFDAVRAVSRGPPAPTPSTRPCWPTRSGWRCSSCSRRCRRPSGWRSCSTTCSPCRSTRSATSSTAHPTAARQLASRARRRVQGAPAMPAVDLARQREVVDAFLAASRDGRLRRPARRARPRRRVPLRRVRRGAGGLPVEVRGARAVAEQYVGRAVLARSALVDGRVGVVVAPLGHLVVVLAVTIDAGRITAIDAVADPAHLARLDLAVG